MRSDGFGGMAVVVTADAIKGKSTQDIIGDFLDEAEHGPLAAAPGFGVHVLLRLHEEQVRQMIPRLIEADETLTSIAAAAVTDADIRAACIKVAERLELKEEAIPRSSKRPRPPSARPRSGSLQFADPREIFTPQDGAGFG